jgi:thioredoxin reductase
MQTKKNYQRRVFLSQGFLYSSLFLANLSFSSIIAQKLRENNMSKELYIKVNKNQIHFFDVIIVGASYSGLAAAMALGRSMKSVLIIDSNKACNRQTPYSHNFITHDGSKPSEIASQARAQVEKYPTIFFLEDIAIEGRRVHSKSDKFEIQTAKGYSFSAYKLLFTSGIKDIMPNIKGFDKAWGISLLHCPYCHGYEVKNEKTGILLKSEKMLEFVYLISNWTKDLTIYSNGQVLLNEEQKAKLKSRNIDVNEKEIVEFEHTNGYLQNIIFKDSSKESIKVLYASLAFEQNCKIPKQLNCELTEEGYLKVDHLQKTTESGIYACGDNSSRMRTVANAVSTGTTAGMMLNKEMVLESWEE